MRVGIPKRAHKRFIQKFYNKGLTLNQVREQKKESLFRYLCSISKPGYDLRVYGNFILIVSEGGVGITVLNIPKDYQEKGGKDNGIRSHSQKLSGYSEAYSEDSDYRRKHFKAKIRRKRESAVRVKNTVDLHSS